MPLEDYKDIIASAASITTIGQMLSGVPICYNIVKQGNTENVDVMPFLGGTAISVLMFEYSNILKDDAMKQVNWFGLILNTAYLLCYYIYTNDKKKVRFQSFRALLFVGVLISYAKLESTDKVEYRFGIIITALFMLLIAAPLFSLKEIIQTQCSAILPLPMILTGTLVSFQWLLYGIIIKNNFFVFQNVIGLGLSVIQLALCIIYPRTPKIKPE
ncbi:hypothetical protein R5R35_008342 [Gryllus longicercus]|uniref:Sugar transporter SWEET1 n=1 Tax=Gryllus longicercus TaxID=2509291 RepID=A0AAN9Z0A7_9ORTH